MAKARKGAVDLRACTTRNSSGVCRCQPCVVCGFGPHMAVHGPPFGGQPWATPYDHQYQPRRTRTRPTKGAPCA